MTSIIMVTLINLKQDSIFTIVISSISIIIRNFMSISVPTHLNTMSISNYKYSWKRLSISDIGKSLQHQLILINLIVQRITIRQLDKKEQNKRL